MNIHRKGFPQPSASVNAVPDSLYQAIDGRVWYFPEISNRWTTQGSKTKSDWYAVDFGGERKISSAKIYLYADGKVFSLPDNYVLEYKQAGTWIKLKEKQKVTLAVDTENTIKFEEVIATALRITFEHHTNDVELVELEYY